MTNEPIYAVHGRNNLNYDGYVVLTRGIGRDPNDRHGENFRELRQTPIVRLNHGYHPHGTIPRPEHYADFAQRVAHFVEMSPGCSRWIIGNEMNHEQERPGGRPILPVEYADCYDQCRAAIHALPGHERDEVLVAAVAPWNATTQYDGNPSGDWIRYFLDIQRHVDGVDGFAIHTYARAQTAGAVVADDRMGYPFAAYHNGFRTYRDWMDAIQPQYQGLPVYVTEFCVAGVPWENANTGCVRAAYQEIDTWNHLHRDRPIWCLAMYRWEFDRWQIKDKPNVQADFAEAVRCGYTRPPLVGPQPEPCACVYEERLERIETLLQELLRRVQAGGAVLAGG